MDYLKLGAAMMREGSPELQRDLRSRERAALEIAIAELAACKRIFDSMGMGTRAKFIVQGVLDRIKALVPEAF